MTDSSFEGHEDYVPLQNSRLICGLEVDFVDDIENGLRDGKSNCIDFLVTPLSLREPNQLRLLGAVASRHSFAQSSDLLNCSKWNSSIIGKISSHQLDSEDIKTRKISEQLILQEMSWATHLSLPAVLLPPPSIACANYSSILSRFSNSLIYTQLLVRIPLGTSIESTKKAQSRCDSEKIECVPQEDSWERWNALRTLCDHHPSLAVALEITEDLPGMDELSTQNILLKWLGEPIRLAILPISVFLTNKKGFPTLSKRHQWLVAQLFKHRVQFVFSGSCLHRSGVLQYVQYLRFLHESRFPPFDAHELEEIPYFDFLQAPLQPLMDNLESQTYETFEKDSTKYRQYQEAVLQALMQQKKKRALCENNLENRIESASIVLMVVGAGRGPLVRTSMLAAKQASIDVRIYAVEKNPNAVTTLHSLAINEHWGDQVIIIDADMRFVLRFEDLKIK